MGDFSLSRFKFVEEECWDEAIDLDYLYEPIEEEDTPVRATERLDNWYYYGYINNGNYTEVTWLQTLPLLIGRLANVLAGNEGVSPTDINNITIGPRLLFIFESLPGFTQYDGTYYLNNRYFVYLDYDLTDDYIMLGSRYRNPIMGYIEVRDLDD